jgi:GYF domain 2
MSNRSWFFAANGQQQGPYEESQFRDLIARGAVTAQTLVWSEGMAGWLRAGDVPGLMIGAGAPPPMVPQGGAMMGADHGYGSSGALSADLPLWSFLGYCILIGIGDLLIIPSPWTATAYYRWIAPKIHVPGRPNLSFTGQVGDIWYVLIALALTSYIGLVDDKLQYLVIPAQAALSWMLMRWVVSHLASNGQPLPITFKGSIWGFIGFQVLSFIAFFTIIGWAWVLTAWMRWICRNLEGTRREVVFNATGLQMLWRTIVFVLLFCLIIPIPWVLRWYASWCVSQLAVVERGAYAA